MIKFIKVLHRFFCDFHVIGFVNLLSSAWAYLLNINVVINYLLTEKVFIFVNTLGKLRKTLPKK